MTGGDVFLQFLIITLGWRYLQVVPVMRGIGCDFEVFGVS